MKKIATIGILTILFLAAIPVSILDASSNKDYVQISPKVSVKGPRAKGKPSKATATGILGAPLPSPENRWAVVIGISDYAGEANDIQYADDDALDMLDVLTTYGYPRDHIRLLVSDYEENNATKSEIIEATNWLKKSENSESEVLFFYSGHGARGRANDGDGEGVDEAIVPYECTAGSLIWDGELKTMFSDFETSRIIFVFDSCYSGGMTDLKADGRIVVMACSESGLSYEGEEWGNGQFTYYFADEGILQGLADKYDHVEGVKDIVVEEAYDYAKSKCVYQTPTISDSFENDLLP
ncbi:MAG: caspase family protein [Candidatus Bathyarchaeia archaeon]